MFNTNFLLSMPGGAEWIIMLLLLAFILVCPVLAIGYYLQAKRLKQENQELRARLSEKNKQS